MIEVEIKGYNVQVIKQALSSEYGQAIKFFKEWYDCQKLNLLAIFLIELYRFRINSTLSVNVLFEFLEDNNHVKITIVATGGKEGLLHIGYGAEKSGEGEILREITKYATNYECTILPAIYRN